MSTLCNLSAVISCAALLLSAAVVNAQTSGGDAALQTSIGTVQQATTASRVEPTSAGFINAVQVFNYSPTELYRIYTRPGRVTDIVLQPGEQLVDISGADTNRWNLGNTASGKGQTQRTHISIKPTRADLSTNLILYTDRRAYYIEVTATPTTWMTAVSWEYPPDQIPLAQPSAATPTGGADSTAHDLSLERLDFRYKIKGPRVAWRPIRAFDDGSKVYIQFPPDISQHDMPPLFLVGPRGATQLVNYRVRTPYYIVDRLFDGAELRLGDRKSITVRINRTATVAQP